MLKVVAMGVRGLFVALQQGMKVMMLTIIHLHEQMELIFIQSQLVIAVMFGHLFQITGILLSIIVLLV